MTDNNNRCSFCGDILRTGLTLCVNCWQVDLREELRQKRALQGIIDGQDLTIGKLRALCERLLDHIVNDRVSAAELATGMFERWKKKEPANGVQWEMLLKCRQGLEEMIEKEAEGGKVKEGG